MRRILAILILIFPITASDFSLPVLDPFGLMPAVALTNFSQESGLFYNPSLSFFNPPVIQYSQGKFSMDSSSLFYSLKELKGLKDEDRIFSFLSKIDNQVFSFAMETRNFLLTGKGGGFGYVYYRSMIAHSERGKSFSQENPLDMEVKYLIRDRRVIFFNKSFVLKNKRIIMGTTTKYVFYKDFEISLPVDSKENLKGDEFSMLSMGKKPVADGKEMSVDVGVTGFLTSRALLGLSFLDVPIGKGKTFSPEFIIGALSYSLTPSFSVSTGADLRDYKGDYSLSVIKSFKILTLGGGYRKWNGKNYYSLLSDIRYHHFGGKIGFNFESGGKSEFIFSLALSDAF